ncbi:NIPSNAP family protein [Rossellomorea aquimaris]|uniref:NIPSNAP family protein n=1 Tax=Rossellomorea aquimaris TaxID=189382 RepID=UPI0037C7DC9D
MFYRRKFYLVKKEFVETFNDHFKHTNLPNQLKHGARLVGRWMKDHDEETVEIFAIWEYDSRDDYVKIETSIRNDEDHLTRIRDWYEEHGGRDYVAKEYIIEMRNEALETTIR